MIHEENVYERRENGGSHIPITSTITNTYANNVASWQGFIQNTGGGADTDYDTRGPINDGYHSSDQERGAGDQPLRHQQQLQR